MLSIDLLERFGTALRALGLPIAEELNPGLSDAEMDALTGPLGFALPTELRTLFGWHDGSRRTPDADLAFSVFAPGGGFRPLTEMIEDYKSSCKIAADAAPYGLWLPTFFPVVLMNPSPGAHLDVPEGAPSPVNLVYWGDAESPGEPDLRSVGELFTYYCLALEEGVYVHQGNGRIHISRENANKFTWPNALP